MADAALVFVTTLVTAGKLVPRSVEAGSVEAGTTVEPLEMLGESVDVEIVVAAIMVPEMVVV